jgi:hypothetical protein
MNIYTISNNNIYIYILKDTHLFILANNSIQIIDIRLYFICKKEMFKKSNRNFRSKKVDFDDSDENDSQNSRSNESDLTQSKKTTAETATILSFENETIDDEYEEFKVKKSKESRRIAKELKKSKKEKQKQNTNEQKNFTGSEDLYIKKTNISIQEIAEVENEDIFFKGYFLINFCLIH